MPSAHEDDEWWPAALVLAGIEPAITGAMRAASEIAKPSSSVEDEGDRRRDSPSRRADEVRLEEQIKRSRLIAKVVRRWSLVAWEGRGRDREGEDESILGGGERGESVRREWGRRVGERRRERWPERDRRD